MRARSGPLAAAVPIPPDWALPPRLTRPEIDGEEGGLCIGYLEYAMHSGVLPTALRELRGDRPAVHIALYNQQSDVQLEGLRQRSLDIALVCEPPAFDDPDLEATQVLNDPMLLAVPAAHALASAELITPADLASQQWIGVMHRENALRHDTFIAACAKAGFTPTIAMEATEEDIHGIVYPHPTMSEAMHEAALDAYGRVLHI